MLNTEMAHIHYWQIDEDFLSRFNKSASEAAIISFDIFDTALTRLFDSPVDVFLETERILLQKIDKISKDVKIVFTVSADDSELPESVKAFID